MHVQSILPTEFCLLMLGTSSGSSSFWLPTPVSMLLPEVRPGPMAA